MDHSEVKHFPKVDHAPAELDEASRLLLKAAALIEQKGWCQGTYKTGSGFCLMGAIMAAEIGDGDSLNRGPIGDVATERLMKSLGTFGWLPWNDTKGRTKDEVVAKLRAVALGL